MKYLMLAAAAALGLVSCGGGLTGGGANTQPPASSYPYNPAANPTETYDTRVPYYGEWLWAAAFSDGTTWTGKMSISKRITGVTNATNVGGGYGVWCASGTDCAYSADAGMIGTFADSGSCWLGAALYETDVDQVKFAVADTDNRVGTEINGKPTVAGNGLWFFYDGTYSTIGFAMYQRSTTPPVKLASTSSDMPRVLQLAPVPADLAAAGAHDDLTQRAIEVLQSQD